MATGNSHLLRLKRTDKKSEYLLLHISRNGPRSLDLKIIGTDNVHLYHGSIKEAGIKSLQANNFTGDLEEFKATLAFAFLHQRPEGAMSDSLQGVESVAVIKGTTATITLRKNIGGITQKLGAIELQQDHEREEVDLFEWVDTAVATSDELRAQVVTSQSLVTSQQNEIASLTSELGRLVKAKKEHDVELLSKFAPLLNSKKLKIRDQQRLLSGAKLDPEIAADISDARSAKGRSRQSAGASREGKRKADELDDGDDEDDDVDDEDQDEDEDRRHQHSPETDDADATDDELEGDGSGLAPAPDDSQTTGRIAGSQATTSDRSQQVSQRVEVGENEQVPPRRELPFNRNPAAKSPTPVTSEAIEKYDDETDEDEL